MRITREQVISEEEIEVFRQIYRDAFEPLEELSPLRQSMTDDEFREEMRHESVIKLVAWDDAGKPAAILCMTNDISRIPWLNPRFYAKRFPEHYSESRIYFFGSLLVHPERRGEHFLGEILAAAVRIVASFKGIAAYDCCKHNVEVTQLPDIISAVGEEICCFERELVDYQNFYAYVSSGLKGSTQGSS